MNRNLAVMVVALMVMFSGCESASYVKSEVTGTAKPEGGTSEAVPLSKTFGASSQAVRRATLQVLDDQGYVYEENSSTGTIKTEPKLADMELVKLSRLSVQSVTPEQWKLVCKMGGI